MKGPWSVLHRSNGSSHRPNGDTHAGDKLTDSEVSRRELRQLKWLTALVPGAVVLIYEYARQETLEHVLPALPVQYGNVVVWVLVLLLTYAFGFEAGRSGDYPAYGGAHPGGVSARSGAS